MKTLTDKLEKLTKEQLIAILESLSSQSKTYEKEVKTLVSAYDPKEFYKLVSKEVTSITSNRKFYGYWECRIFADKIRAVVNKIDNFLVPQAPDLAIKLANRIIDKEDKIAEHIDDSNGEMGSAFYDLFIMLDKAYAKSNCKPKEIASFIIETYKKSQYGLLELVTNFSRCLSEDVLSELEKMLVPINELKPMDVKNYKFDYDESFHKLIADKRKDVDSYISVIKAKDGLDNASYLLNIAKRLIEAFREDEAIEYLNKITQDNFFCRRDQLLIEAYLLDGNITEIKKIYYNQIFDRSNINTDAYLKYIKYANADESQKVKEDIKGYIDAKPFSISTIETLYTLGEYNLLEDALVDFVKSGERLDMRSVSEVRKISTSIAKEKPLVAVLIRRLLVADCLDGKKSKYYDYAVSDLKKSIEFGEFIEVGRDIEHPVDHFNSLIEKHKKKVSFWSRVANANLKELIEKIYLQK
jgi:hypothetical protein